MTNMDSVNLGSYISFTINATEVGVVVPETRCWFGSFRWHEDDAQFVLVHYYEFVEECSSDTGHVTTINDDCYIYTNGLGRLGTKAYIDPTFYELGDVGRISIGCGEGYQQFNFTVDNYRPVDSMFGTSFQWLMDNPAAIFGLFISFLIGSIILVIVLTIPVILLRRFWE